MWHSIWLVIWHSIHHSLLTVLDLARAWALVMSQGVTRPLAIRHAMVLRSRNAPRHTAGVATWSVREIVHSCNREARMARVLDPQVASDLIEVRKMREHPECMPDGKGRLVPIDRVPLLQRIHYAGQTLSKQVL